MSKNNKEDKIKKEIDEEIKSLNSGVKKDKKKRKKRLVKAFADKEKEYNKRKFMYILEMTVVVIFSLVMLVLLCNRTFFREEYKTSKIDLNIPLLMFFENDTGNEITLKTLRKSKYVKDFFEDELSTMVVYKCGEFNFYYDYDTRTAIYNNIDVKKDGLIKTVKIEYAIGDADCLCVTKLKGEQAEALCNK